MFVRIFSAVHFEGPAERRDAAYAAQVGGIDFRQPHMKSPQRGTPQNWFCGADGEEYNIVRQNDILAIVED